MSRKQRNKHYGSDNRSSTLLPIANSSKYSDNSGSGFPEHLLRHININCGNQHHPQQATLETLVPNAVFVARDALSSKECQEWINYAENNNAWDVVSHPATKWIAHRECGRVQKNDWNMSHRLYQRIESVVQQISPQLDIFDKASLQSNSEKYIAITKSNNLPKYQPITCNPNLRLYKYTKGQWFGRHVDDSNRIDIPSVSTLSKCNNTSMNAPTFAGAANVKEAQTEITVLFYLSSCRGGATTFHPPHQRKKGGASVSFTPEEGAVLLHVHGDHCLEHEAEPVLEGVKYVLRTDIVYGIV